MTWNDGSEDYNKIYRLERRVQELEAELAHERHEKETAADAYTAYQKWAHARIDVLESLVEELTNR